MVDASDYDPNPDAMRQSIVIDPATLTDNAGDDVLTSDSEANFSVSNPHDNGGHIVYEVSGRDSQGLWEGKRRFNEFFCLFEALQQRWPGIPIPFIPEKKAIGNKDMSFLADRTFYLQRFL